MSYHVQHSSQQKSLGIIVVVAFHAVLIFALIAGLKVSQFPDEPEAITFKQIKEKPVDAIPIDPSPIDISEKTTITIPIAPTPTFESEPAVTDTGAIRITGGEPGAKTVMSKPSLKNPTTPAYPTASARMNEEGSTGLNLYITADGRVSEASVYSSSGYSRLDDAAVKHALRYWRFTPCVENGTAVGCWYQTKLTWRLENAKR
jgi:periplasmic protein TonB